MFRIPELSSLFVTAVLLITGISFSITSIVQYNQDLSYGPFLLVALITIVPGIYGLSTIVGQPKYQRLINQDIY